MSIINDLNYVGLLSKFDTYQEYKEEIGNIVDDKFWDQVQKQDTKQAYEIYLALHSNGIYAIEAKRNIEEFLELERSEAAEKQRLRDIEIVKDKVDWKIVLNKNTKESYENYLEVYPDGLHSWEAKKNINRIIKVEAEEIRELNRQEDKEAWGKASNEDKSWSYYQYLEKYPNGTYCDEAKNLFEMLHMEITTEKYPNNRLFKVQSNGKEGVIDRDKKIIIEEKYDDIWSIGGRFIVVKKSDKEGLYSAKGKMILEPGNYNLRIDCGGYKTEIIEKDDVGNFRISTISEDEQWLYNPNYIKIFDTSIIKIKDIKNNSFGYISHDDKLLLKPIYKNIYLYKNGLGQILRADGGKDSSCGLINKKFEIILDSLYGHISWNSSNSSFACIRNKEWTKIGIVSDSGKIVVDFIFDSIEDLDNGFFIGWKGERPENLKYGLINNDGKIVIDVVYDNITYLKNERIFLLYKNKKFGFANSKGEITIPPELKLEYSDHDMIKYYFRGFVFDEKESLLLVKKNDKLGLVDKEGGYVLSPVYDMIEQHDNQYSQVIFLRQENKVGFVDKNGNFILNLDTYLMTRDYYDSVSTIKLNGLYGLINWNTGKIILPIQYSSLSCKHLDNGIYKFTVGFKSGLVNQDGEVIIDLINFIQFNLLKKKFLDR